MNLNFFKNCFLLLTLSLAFSCVKLDVEEEDPNSVDPDEETALTELQFPANFTFSTDATINVTINDPAPFVVYEAYGYQEELFTALDSITGPLPGRIFEMPTSNGQISQKINLPTYIESLYLIRKDGESIETVEVAVSGNQATYTHETSGKSRRVSKSQIQAEFDCGNPYGQETYIDVSNAEITKNGDVDDISNLVFPIQGAVASITATSVNGMSLNSPFSLSGAHFSTPVYTLDGFTEWISSQIDTDKDSDGYVEFEMTFDQPMTNILMHFKSVHASRYEFIGDQHTEMLISGGTEFEYDSSSRQLMDTNTNSKAKFERDGYGSMLISAASGTFDKIIWRRIDDPTTNSKIDTNWFIFTEVPDCSDSDNDGAADSEDEFPNDPTKAFKQSYPSASSRAALAFEDLWPFLGDYDFNDTMLDYQVINYFNASNLLVAIDFVYSVTSDGASFSNSFAININGLDPSDISSVEGQLLNENVFNVQSNGTESNQQTAVIPIFDNHSTIVGQDHTIRITMSSGITIDDLEDLPYDPFLIINGEREREIHLIDKSPTNLGDALPDAGATNADADGNYATSNGLPWAINIIQTFPVVKEKEPINEAYLFFEEWAISGGLEKSDWFKDIDGYRDSSKLK